MGKRVVSAADIMAARAAGRIVVPRDAILTPLARDTARDVNVAVIEADGEHVAARPDASAPAAGDLATKVRAIVASLLDARAGALPAPAGPRSGARVKHAAVTVARPEKFPYPGPPPDMQVKTVDVVTVDDGSPVAVGYMTMTKGSFPWTLTYDEVQVVLEGELHLGGEAGGKVGRPGDVLFVPNGSSITFGTPDWVKFVYVTFPANWEDQIG
jgi:ethanolamine utilization protein EutQ